MTGDDDAVGLEVRDAVAVVVAELDGFAQQHEVLARLFVEVAADGPVVIGDEEIGGLALRAVERYLKRAMERCRGQRSDGVGSGLEGDENIARQS